MKNGLDLGNSQKYPLQKLPLLINTEATSNPGTDFFEPSLKINARHCVGRNKAFRAQAIISVSGIRTRVPETPPRATLGWSYSGRLIVAEINLLQTKKFVVLEINRGLSPVSPP